MAKEQKEIARAKIKLDLFERRYAVYEKTVDFVEGVRAGTSKKPHTEKYERIMSEAAFLFGKDMESYLREIYFNCFSLSRIEARIEENTTLPDDPSDRKKYHDYLTAQQTGALYKQFSPYLNFEKWRR